MPYPSPSHDACEFLLDVLILSENAQRTAARCEEVIVVYDYTKGRKMEVPAWMVTAFKEVWEEQERERRRWLARAIEVERMVEDLEADTWGKDGAMEDMGTQ